MTAPTKKITWCVIYLIKVIYTSYNYTLYKSTWTSLRGVRVHCLNIYTVLANFCFALVILTYLGKDPSKKVSHKETKEVTKLEKQK